MHCFLLYYLNFKNKLICVVITVVNLSDCKYDVHKQCLEIIEDPCSGKSDRDYKKREKREKRVSMFSGGGDRRNTSKCDSEFDGETCADILPSCPVFWQSPLLFTQ